MRGRPLLILGLLLVQVGFSRSAGAQTPRETMEAAEREFRYQNYEAVVELLTPLLEPTPQLPTREEVLRAREMLGSSQWWMGRKGPFKQQFTLILQEDAAYELDSFYFPPGMVGDFQDLKQQLLELGIIQVEVAPELPPREILVVERTRIQRNSTVNLVPFGVGQFVNGQTGKGVFFLTSELVMLGVNTGSWVYMATASPTGASRDWAIGAMYSGVGLFAALVIWGIVDSYLHFTPEEVLEEKRMQSLEPSDSIGGPVPPSLSLPVGFGLDFPF